MKTKVREGIVLSRQNQTGFHAISWMSRIARKVAQSTSTAELLAATDAVNKRTYYKHHLEETLDIQMTELVLDKRSALHLCSKTKDLEELMNKLDFDSTID